MSSWRTVSPGKIVSPYVSGGAGLGWLRSRKAIVTWAGEAEGLKIQTTVYHWEPNLPGARPTEGR